MADERDPPKTKRQAHDEALAAALRANLRRRKTGTLKAASPGLPKKEPDEG